jgi:RimJ/RimL family protein N-acetyltransferase
MTPTLNTERLVLRPLTKATQRQVDWLRDPQVVAFSEQRHAHHSLSSQLTYIRSRPPGSHLWAIEHVADGAHIGNISADADEPNHIADLGVMIGDREQWGKGFATEAFKAASAWLLDKDAGGFRKLECGFMAANHAMRKVAERSGFTFEGERRAHFMLGNELTAAVYYGRFR